MQQSKVKEIRLAADLQTDSIVDGPGLRAVIWTQGCPHNCPGCHNQGTWDFNGGYEFTQDTINSIIHALNANGVQRNLCIMGGEPLHERNQFLVQLLIQEVKKVYPNIKIYLWTGYVYEDLIEKHEKILQNILQEIDVLIDGPFIQEQRDITLAMRGSKNQRILNLKELRRQ